MQTSTSDAPASKNRSLPVLVARPDFDYPQLLKDSVARQAREIFSDSPLTSPEPSRPSSPTNQDFFSLSPLTSPEPSLPSSPTHSSFFSPGLSSSPPPSPSTSSKITLDVHEDRAAKKRRRRQAWRINKRARVKEALLQQQRPAIGSKSINGNDNRGNQPISRKHIWRQKKRAREREALQYQPKPAIMVKSIEKGNLYQTGVSIKESQVTSRAYVAARDASHSEQFYGLKDLVGVNSEFKYKLLPWDGQKTKPIVDCQGRLVAILAGSPKEPSWPQLVTEAANALENARRSSDLQEKVHRRGKFSSLGCGVSHGGGQTAPGNLKTPSPHHQKILADLNQTESFQRISGFANSVFRTWMPKLYDYYSQTLQALYRHDPSLRPAFHGSVFAATTYNLGPRTVCLKHRDFRNLAFGMCAITALGSFDPKKGGHLILWDCGLVIEFPPGATILIPSATISHSNAMVGQDERRYSFTQYTAGGLFRWVENGFRTWDRFKKSLRVWQLDEMAKKDTERWAWGLSLIPVIPNKSATDIDAGEAATGEAVGERVSEPGGLDKGEEELDRELADLDEQLKALDRELG